MKESPTGIINELKFGSKFDINKTDLSTWFHFSSSN